MTVTLKAGQLGRWGVAETSPRIDAPGAVVETISAFTWADLAASLARAGELGAEEVLVEADFPRELIDEDGSVLVEHLPPISFPGVRVSFTSRHGRLVFHADQYAGDWRFNVVMVAGLLEALAECDQYGAGGRQYAGWRADPQTGPRVPLNAEQAGRALIDLAGIDEDDVDDFLASPAKIRRAFLLAEQNTDKPGELRTLRGILAPLAGRE